MLRRHLYALLRGTALSTGEARAAGWQVWRRLGGHCRAPDLLCGAIVALGLAAGPVAAQTVPAGLPTGGVFVAGAGQISQPSPTALSITQSSQRGVIDWGAFSIATQHQVHIDNASGATLNRVLGGQISQIDGKLSATGSVYLMNPHGVIVGPGGRVLTGGSFVASTRQIDPGAFMAGGPLAISGTSAGAIVNQGSIVSQSGSVVMIARAVTNSGTIQASKGRVSLAAANDVLLATTDGKAENIFVSFANGGDGDVTQTGRIEAAAAALKTAGGNIFALAGNRDGLVQATGTETINGELWLAAPKGKVEVSGTLAATNVDGSGGTIGVNGKDVRLASSAYVTAAGSKGGEVLVGASHFGTGSELAESLTIESSTTLLAGGALGGGRIETSGKAVDIGTARIDAGKGGLWLLDPSDITIDTALAATITASLDGGTDVTQETASGSGGAGDITVAAPVIWTGSGDLTLDAFRNLAVNQQISGGGSVTLRAAGSTTLAASVASTGNVLVETGSFINQAGAAALTAGGQWLVYSGDPANDTTGGLTPGFYQYAAPFGTAPAAAGNGLLYSIAPSVAISLGAVTKSYDGTTTAFLDDTNTTVTGLINNDDWTLDGVYASKDSATGIAVTANNFQATHDGIPVFGYASNAPVTASTGTINPAVLTASIIGNPTKTYNASAAVALTSANFALAGVAAGETITVSAAATAAYDAANAGNRTVNATFSTPNFSAGSGTSLTNYVLPTVATGPGLINPAQLLISGLTANDKVYDGTTAAVLNTGAASLFGIVGSDVVSLDAGGATGIFATKNVGNAIAVTGTGFTLSGAAAANYVVSQPTGLAANITPAALLVSGLTANDKIYDGTRFATVNTGGLIVSGLIPGDDVVPVAGTGAQIEFASKDVAQDIPVTISGVTLSGVDAGNYNFSFAAGLAADITPRPLTLAANGLPTKIYDGTTNAFVDQSQVALGNFAPGETISLTQASGLNYASKNVGVWDIAISLSPSDFQAAPGTLLSNYLLPTLGTIQGEITAAPLTIIIINNPTKGYDGNANASLGPSNFEVDGFVVGEGATVTQTSGQYASSDAGVWTVTASLDASNFNPDPGTLMSNYIVPSPVTGPGTITRIPLGPGVVIVDITGNPTKVYDGTIVATLSPSDYTLSGFIPGEGAIVTETVGEYADPNAGQKPVFVQLDPTDFLPFPNTNLNNYTLPTEATGVGTILKALLTASIIGNPTRVYDGATRIGLNPSSFLISGLIGSESISVTPGNIGDYDTADAGSRIVSAFFPSQASFIAGPGTLLANYVLPLDASGPGTITPAPLNILNVSAQNKVYDQTTVAQLAGAVTLFGVIAGDDVTLDPSASTGTFATPNVGTGIAVTVAGYTIAGADIGNYQLFQPGGLAANITPRGLTIANVTALDKIYDGTTAATLDGSASLIGVLSGDTVLLNASGSTASFLQSNVGTDLRVNIGGYSIAGPQAGNYSLSQPSGLTADINPRPLSGAILGNPTKTYDGTTQVSLGASNYSLTGFITGEGGAITQSAGAAYDSPNAGARTVNATIVVSDIVPNAGTLLSNYLLPTVISGPGTINPAQLIASIINNPTKVYDATTAAILTSSNFSVQGFVAGEGATVTQTAGIYDSKNAGSRVVTASLAAGDYAPTGGTILTNYVLPVSASGAGTITQAQVQVIDVLALDKIYDGTIAASLDSSNADLTGVFAGDTVNVVSTGATGTFDNKNVGTNKPVTATGYAIAGTDAANYLVLQPVGLFADITQATIALASVTKVYDATTTAPTANSAYTLAGAFGSDDVSVNASGITGDYNDKNVGTGKPVTLAGVALTGADAPNYIISPTTTSEPIGIITPATLNVIGAIALDKTYDQNTIAQLDNTSTALSGVFAGDVVNLSMAATGNFDNPNAGTNKPVTTTAYGISGTDAPNYTLVQPQGLTADINPLEIFLASVTKVYDGTIALPTASSGYGFTGVLSGDTVEAQTSGVTGQYNDSKDVGTAKPVTVNGLTLTGTSGGNYFISSSITDTIGTITQATLTAAIIGNPTKTYDGNANAILTPANFQFTGFVLSEGASVTQTAGAYNSQNVDATTVTASLAGFITPDAGTDLNNYIVPVSASGAGTIDARLLTISGVIANNKVYDGSTAATLNSVGAILNNVVSGDTVALNSAAATGVFASPNVGTAIPVTASGYTLDNNPFGNYVLQQPQGLAADITQALLQLIRVTKVYDGGFALPTVNAAYTLGGVVAGDDVSVNAAAITGGGYATKDVATGIAVDVTGLSLTGTAAGNYSIVNVIDDALIGEITPATLTATIINNPTKTYDGSNAATLTSANYQLTGFVLSEGATVTQTAGLYDSANAGGRIVTATLASGDFTADAGTLLSNYILPTDATGAGTIDPKALLAAIIGNPTKTYDGNATATLIPANYNLVGLVGSESMTINQTVGAYASPNAGPHLVTAALAGTDFTAGAGTLLANYVLPTSAEGLGTINRADLVAAIIGNPTKIFDGNAVATLGAANYQLTGFVAGEGATVTQTLGTYDSANAGARTVTAALGATDFSANTGTLLDNYNLPTSATGPGQIDPRALLALIIGNPTKPYDGTVAATLGPANYQLTGFVGADSAIVTETVGAYDSANAGIRTVTAQLDSGDFTAGGSTLLSNYVLPTQATGPGQIDRLALSAAIIGNPTKTYDGTLAATLTAANYDLTGFIAGEGATVNQTAGLYDGPNAGAHIVTATLGAANFSPNSGTLLDNYILPLTASGAGQIDPRVLRASIIGLPTKTYDGTTAALLTPGNFALAGFVSGEGAAVTETVGVYGTADAGIKLITSSLDSGDFVANSGTLLSNYILPTSAIGSGIISKAQLAALIIGNPTKIYDQTTAATLTSANYALTGFVAGQGATITETAGEYGSPNAGARLVTAMLGSADFVANGGTDLRNYALPLTATGPGTIDPKEITLILLADPTKVYDGTLSAVVPSIQFRAVGFLGSDGLSVESTATGTYADKNVGLHAVLIDASTAKFIALPGTDLANYALRSQAVGIGRITPAPLTATLVDVVKTYDGTTSAVLTPPNFMLNGFVAGEGASVTETVGIFATPDAGLRAISATLDSGDFVANSGTLLSNYNLPTAATGTGLINPAQLGAVIVGNPTKTYDGTLAALLGSANYQLTGFITGQGATVTETAGSYDSINAGARMVTATLETADFTADAGTLLSNYVLPTTASGPGQIDPARLIATLTGVTKIYDGTTAAILNPSNFTLGGLVGSDSMTVTETAGLFASSDAGTRAVTAMLDPTDFAANGSTLLSNYVLPTDAAGLGRIDTRQLLAAIIGNPTKGYDATTAATLASANYALTGFVAGQGATVTETVGVYDSANAGARTVTATLDGTDLVANSGTLLSNYVLPMTATGPGQIDPRALAAAIINNPTRIYNGTTAATLAPSNFALTGFLGSDGATVTQTVGSYDDKNAGSRIVTATLGSGNFTANGSTLLSNYILPTSASGPGQIDRATITAAIIGNPTKTYDGNTDAILTSDNFALSGFAPGEGALVTETFGTYDAREPGDRTVTVALEPDDFTANTGTLFSNYILPTTASGPGTIIPDRDICVRVPTSDCFPDFPDLFLRFGRTVGNPHFYIPYPVVDPIYLGRTNAFSGLPSIVAARSTTPSDTSVVVQSGAPTINSTEQVLIQGRRAKNWQVQSTLPLTVNFLEGPQ
ncbi:YDG domain-containing protein [Sphingomonas cavernae]|uniref:Filamentous hemagglutinin N-terminal domain-containing protein n=1 Tax=Sphingomonas cavernae TaxID=2320861 RepID=A0A418WUL3_9SPHN|nr:YDG domain-containing protein [Sphingomonas cavernae]RJF96382.1 filamentous hemagglutinin N-terminal domain-containing protein [Sphingomonas cavernae]